MKLEKSIKEDDDPKIHGLRITKKYLKNLTYTDR